MIHKFLEAQKKYPVKGDWVQVLRSNMTYIDFHPTDDELRQMKKAKLKSVLKQKIHKKSLEYLLEMRKVKGKDINYYTIEILITCCRKIMG